MNQIENSQAQRDRLLKAKCYRLIDAISQKTYSSKLLEAAVRSLTGLVEYKNRTSIFTKPVPKSKIKK